MESFISIEGNTNKNDFFTIGIICMQKDYFPHRGILPFFFLRY